MNRTDLQKLMDVCRGDADLQLEELQPLAEQLATDPDARRLWERTRRWDESMRQALHDVPVPEGLEKRLLDRLAGSAVAGSAPKGIDAESGPIRSNGQAPAGDAEPLAAPQVLNVPRLAGRPARLRQWAVVLGSAAALLAAVLVMWRPTQPQQDNELELVQEWLECVDDAEWSSEGSPEQMFPLPAQLNVQPRRWQVLEKLRGSWTVVCYDLPSRGDAALLFVARGKLPSLQANSPPPFPKSLSSWTVGAWSGPSTVYVLAVKGGTAAYQSILRVGSRRVA
jgi:hypothetical protein